MGNRPNLPTDELSNLPTISVITICKNSSATIEQTISSVISQKTASVEYIIIDGDSNDGTQGIVLSFGDKIDVFISEPDDGIADAFNKGIARAKGEVISLINSDDVLLPGAIKNIQRLFVDYPDAQVIHGDILLYKGNSFVKQVKPADKWWYPWRLVLFNHPATFVRKEVYCQCDLFSCDYRIAMDVEIFLRWIKAGVKIVYYPGPFVIMHYGGLSDRHAFAGYREVRTALLEKGFSRFLTDIQYFCKFIIHSIGRVQSAILVHLRN
jgi:glycosyltransferase involved in cell wall biosynthesis